jgi:hypothetical protein
MDHDSEVRFAIGAARDALVRAAEQLDRLATSDDVTVDAWQDVSAGMGIRMAVHREQLAKVSDLLGLGSAQQRLLRYLQRHVGQVVSGAELSGVSGIAEWPRRIRELRVEHGWPIESGVQRPSLRTDEYILLRLEPDEALAAKWQLASGIRKGGGEVKDRLLAFLKAVCPEVADQEELSYVSNTRSWEPGIELLRREGWDIRSSKDEADLPDGSYRLVL